MATVGNPGAIQQPPASAGSLGQGVSYPLAYDPNTGRLKLSWGVPLVEQQMQAVWETAPKERVMLPRFGAAIGEFEPIDLARQVAIFKQQVKEYVPAVDTVDVVSELGPGVGEATITVTYTLKSDDSDRTLTFPAFVGP